MIEILFKYTNEHILVVVKGNQVFFGNTEFGNQLATIDGLRLDYNGVINEFPDLKTDDNWKKIAIERFKKKISSMITEEEVYEYILDELKKCGYVPLLKKKLGFRPIKIK